MTDRAAPAHPSGVGAGDRILAGAACLGAALSLGLMAAGAHLETGRPLLAAAGVMGVESAMMLAAVAARAAGVIGGRLVGMGLWAGLAGALVFVADMISRAKGYGGLAGALAPAAGGSQICAWALVALGSLLPTPSRA